jgi:hypothetical protein
VKMVFQIKILVLLGLILGISDSNGQTPWSGVYGNEWLNYNNTYVKIPISGKGLYKIPFSSLPANFPKVGANFQLWHRGKEVAILSTENNEILFYAEKNDGKSDELMFRPGPEARLNPYSSLFSEIGAYFLTYTSGAKRAVVVNGKDITGSPQPYHFQKDIVAFANQFAQTTDGIASNLNHSYYDETNSWTGPTIFGANTTGANKVSSNSFQMKNWVSNAPERPVLELMVNGLHTGEHAIQVSVGKSDLDTDQSNVTLFNFFGFGGRKISNFSLTNDNVTPTGSGVIKLRSNTTGNTDRFSLTYYSILYPQQTTMSGLNVAYFNFKPSSQPVQVNITNVPSDILLYDITNIDEPKVISGNLSNSSFAAMVPGNSSTDLKLFAASAASVTEITANQITSIELQPYFATPAIGNVTAPLNPSTYDYLIITNNLLKSSAMDYAKYRNSTAGGSYSTIVFDIASIYNVFNYGEPSPVAIKRFADYMLKNGIRSKHNLVLIGNNVTLPSRLQKEMPDEVPTFGDPGSDILLVSGLQGVNMDVPAIPVGRIPAFFANQVADYLGKVKQYESETQDLSWRKKVLHLAGGKSAGEEDQFVSILDNVKPIVTADNTRSVQTFMADNPSSATSPANITGEVNNGVGLISYYGHGSPSETILNVGLVSKESSASNNYSSTGGTYNNTKYPLMYFNGCGVGNLFSRNSQQGDVLSRDWLLTPGKGSIAIIANSFNSYVSPTITYLEVLYKQLFSQSESAVKTKTIGQVHRDAARIIINGSANSRTLAADAYDITNILSVNAKLTGTGQVTVDWATAWEKNNSHFVVERSYNARNFEDIGFVEGKGDISTKSSYSFIDNKPLNGVNYYRIRQVDKTNSISSDDDSFSRIVVVKVGNDEQSLVYPNPTPGNVDITVSSSIELKSWILFDSNGNRILEGTKSSLSVEKFSKGLYILEIHSKNGDVYRKKIVKE